MILFKQYFCSFNLKEGTIALGILSLITSIIYFLGCIYLITIGTRLDDYFADQIDQELGNELTVQTAERAIKIFIQLLVIECLFTFFSALAMIVGAKTNNRFYLLPWLFGDLVQTLMIFSTIYVILRAAILNDDLTGFSAGSLIFCSIIWSVTQIYLWLCVVSLFQKIRDEANALNPKLLPQKRIITKTILRGSIA